VVPFSIALINQASCAADSFPDILKCFFICWVPMNSSLPLPACTHHRFWLGALHVLPLFLFLFVSFCDFFSYFWFHAMVIFRCFCRIGKACNDFELFRSIFLFRTPIVFYFLYLVFPLFQNSIYFSSVFLCLYQLDNNKYTNIDTHTGHKYCMNQLKKTKQILFWSGGSTS
jgi:hypothetical protein